jgi:PAS domain S-box-containing protein
VASSDDAIISKDLNGTITSWNAAAQRIFGYAPEEAVGRHIGLIIPPERMDEETHIISRIRKGERVEHFETIRRHKTGRPLDISVTISPIRAENGDIIGASKIARDIGEYKRMVADLKRSNEELEKFAHVAAHDLKSPLRGIDNLARWIIDDYQDKLPDEAQKMLGMLRARVGRLERFLDDILSYSRAGHTDEQVSETDVNAMVADLAQTHLPESFNLNVPAPLPRLVTFATPLRQVFANLVANAVKHHHKGGGQISITAMPSGSYYEFVVSDDGPGIPPDDQDRVFQMFQTLRPRDEVEGSGMGLALVKKLVEWQGGRVWIVSEPGKRGTEMHFLWPGEAPAELALPRRKVGKG